MELHYKNLSLENIEGEIWMDCFGYDGIYSVSNYGRIKSERRRVSRQIVKERILKQTFDGNGEPTVKFSINNIKKTKRIMDLVGDAFLGEKKPDEVYCRVNKKRSDNTLKNIIITTRSKSNEINFETGVQQDWGIGEMMTKNKDERAKLFEIYENGILKRKICSCCFRELEITHFYFRSDNTNYGHKCIECVLKHDGVIDVGKNKNRKELALAGLRYCSICKELKNLDTDFTNSINGYLGKSNTCKSCSNINGAKYRMRQKEINSNILTKK